MRTPTVMKWTTLVALSIAIVAFAANATRAADEDNNSAWLGVFSQSLNDDLRDGLDYKGAGVLINRVVEGSPADDAGLRKGDIVVTFNSRSVDSAEELTRLVRDASVGQNVSLGIVRDGQRRTIQARLGERPEEDFTPEPFEYESPETPETPMPPMAPRAPRAPNAPRSPKAERYYLHGTDPNGKTWEWNGDGKEFKELKGLKDLPDHIKSMVGDLQVDGDPNFTFRTMGRGRLGVRVESLNADLASALGVSGGRGVLVLEVLKDTPAEKAGLHAGDVITRASDKPVYDSDDLVQVLRGIDGKVALSVTRKGQSRTIEAELEEAPRGFMRLRGDSGPMGRMEDRSRRLDRGQMIAPRAPQTDGDLREEVRALREQLRDLKKQMEDMKHD